MDEVLRAAKAFIDGYYDRLFDVDYSLPYGRHRLPNRCRVCLAEAPATSPLSAMQHREGCAFAALVAAVEGAE